MLFGTVRHEKLHSSWQMILKEKTWYSVVGLEISSANAPYTWLRIGSERQHQVCRVCVGLVKPYLGADSRSERILLPRRRETLEAQNGKLNYELIKTWLRLCGERHEDTCGRSTILERRFLNIYLISVHTRSIRLANPTAKYVAPSYVWGDTPHAQYAEWIWNSSSEMGQGTTEISLPLKLPQTVEDVMEFTASISQRYL